MFGLDIDKRCDYPNRPIPGWVRKNGIWAPKLTPVHLSRNWIWCNVFACNRLTLSPQRVRIADVLHCLWPASCPQTSLSVLPPAPGHAEPGLDDERRLPERRSALARRRPDVNKRAAAGTANGGRPGWRDLYAGAVAGNSMVKTAPPAGPLAPATLPPWASTIALTTLSPSPRPRCDRL